MLKTSKKQPPRHDDAKGMHNDIVSEQQVRTELFYAAKDGEQTQSNGGNSGQNEPTIDQLVKEAKDTHRDTTNTLQRTLKVMENTKQVQAATLKELDDQGEAINRINYKLHNMNAELTYSERLLRYMRRWCCCWMCDACTGADPEGQVKNEWKKRVDKGKTAASDKAYDKKEAERKAASASSRAGKPGASSGGGGLVGSPDRASQGSPSAPRYRDPDIRLTEEHQRTELALNDETRKQNEMLDQIHDAMGDLLNGAKRIGDELKGQSQAVTDLNSRAENTKGRIDDMNSKSQLRKFRGK